MAYILYVEDNEDNIYMLKRRLERRGFELDVASDGERALHMAATNKPALILMDLILPGIDGWETTRRLRSNPELDDVPIIALSSSAMPDEKKKALEAGCNDFESKPVDMNALLAKIAFYLEPPLD